MFTSATRNVDGTYFQACSFCLVLFLFCYAKLIFLYCQSGQNLTSNIGNVKSFSKNFKKAHRPNFSLSNVEIWIISPM